MNQQWDKIYKRYKREGKGWATLLIRGLDPNFKKFIHASKFAHKRALDIGCGDGRYLVFLNKLGFEVNGIDASPTAVKISKTAAKNKANIVCADMYAYPLPKETYDLILSISTIHHGRKPDIRKLINKIHRALVSGGKAFLTLPELAQAKQWQSFSKQQKIAPGTFAPLSGPERGLAHSFFTKTEILKMFSKFKRVALELDHMGRWIIQATK